MGMVLRVTSGPHSGQAYLIDSPGSFTVGRSLRARFSMTAGSGALAGTFPGRQPAPPLSPR